jgi:uncharacterized protein (DUF58 family)
MTGARSTLKLAAAFLVAGIFFDSPSLLVPGIGLALLATGSAAWVRLAARATRVERERGPATVVEDEPYPLRIRIRRGLVPPRGELSDPLLPDPLPIRASVRRRVSQVSLPLSFPRRGRHRLEPAKLVVRDPLGLHAREVEGDAGGELLVLPRVEAVMAPGDGGAGAGDGDAAELGEGAGASALDTRAIDFEVDGLRPYREGSPASRIHWPAVARTGELIERRLAAGGDQTPLVVLDAKRPDDADSLDRAVRAAASLCVHLAQRAGGCTLLCPGERRPLRIDPELRAWPVAHARLAVVEAGSGTPAMATARSAGAILWISGRGGRPPRAPRGPGAQISYLVSPHPLAGLPVRFTVAGCHGQPLVSAARRRRAAPRMAA